MIGVDEARARAAAMVGRHGRAWAADPEAAAAASIRVVLRPPNEQQVLAAQAPVIAWRDAWVAIDEPGVTVELERRAWSSLGAQQVPVRAVVTGADAIACFAGGGAADAWARLRERVAAAVAVGGGGEAARAAARAHAGALVDYADAEFVTVLAVVSWLIEHDVEGLRPRQLPIRGVDSKWFSAHRAVVTALVLAASGLPSLGIVDAERPYRVRVLDVDLMPGGPREFGATADELARTALRPRRVLVFENLESVLALPPMSGVVALHGNGFAVSELPRVPWIARSHIVYWGDLDSNGFAILHRLRTVLSEVESILMDDETLLAHRDLWVPEPKPARGMYPTLRPHEQDALDRLRDEGDVRLEQERIPWTYALDRIQAAVDATALDRTR